MNKTVIGASLLAAGAILLFIGIRASDSISDRMSNFFTGQFTDGTMLYIVGGAILVVAGIAMLAYRRRAK